MSRRFLLLLTVSVAIALAQSLVQQGSKLVGTGAVGDAWQGQSVAISADGNTALVGGPYDNGKVGAVWVWTREGAIWTQQGQKLVASDAVGSSWQGISVALSADGNTALSGGYGENNGIGAAWIWTRNESVWTQDPKLVGTGWRGTANQGSAVALSADGNTALIGGAGDDGGVVIDRPYGAVWVWTRSGTVWSQDGPKLVGTGASVTFGGPGQGGQVALSADASTALVGGQWDDDGVGAAWVFGQMATDWEQQGPKLVGSGAAVNASQGFSVALSGDGNTAFEGGTEDVPDGAVWVWTRLQGVWTQQGAKLVPDDADEPAEFGSAIALSGDGLTAVISGRNDRNDSGGGALWVWEWTRAGWRQAGPKVAGTGVTGFAQQGWSLAMSGDGSTVISGGPADDGDLGAAWVFTREVRGDHRPLPRHP
jgi:hypothetical protein